MAKKQKTVAINLLSQDTFEKSFFGKVTHWLLTVGRYIVIFTELVVIVCFLFRFKLDRDLNKLNAEIQNKVEVIDSYQETESKFRDLQARLEFLGMIDKKKIAVTNLLKKVEAVSPTDLTVDKIIINRSLNALTINGRALSPLGFSIFISKLGQVPEFKKIRLDKVMAGVDEVGLKFGLTISLAETEPRQTTNKKVSFFDSDGL